MASSQPKPIPQPAQMGQSTPTPAQMQAQVPAKPLFTDLASI